MKPILRRTSGLLLALMLAATSLTMAVARGQVRVAGEMVICSGYGVTLVQTAAPEGTGTAVHICPDMALSILAALDLAAPDLTRPEGQGRAIAALEMVQGQGREPPLARGRDPPLSGRFTA